MKASCYVLYLDCNWKKKGAQETNPLKNGKLVLKYSKISPDATKSVPAGTDTITSLSCIITKKKKPLDTIFVLY